MQMVIGCFLLGASHTAKAQYTVHPLLQNGPLDRRMTIIVVSEGYKEEEIPIFLADAQRVTDKIFAASPFKEYKSYFNVLAVSVASKDSGIDWYGWGKVRDTHFNATYNDCVGIGVCIKPNADGSYTWSDFKWWMYEKMGYLDPFYMMLINDEMDAGTSDMTARGGSDFAPVVHELGHQFFLADEYIKPAHSPHEARNVTSKVEREQIKWKHWIEAGTPLPTPQTDQYKEKVGLFEGAIQEKGWYRPQLECKMRASEHDFCAVCKEAIISFIYQDERWSNRMTRIRKFLPAAEDLILKSTESLQLSLDAPLPEHGLLLEWFIDGVLVKTGAKELPVTGSGLGVGEHTVELRVKDGTPYVRDPVILPELTKTRTWKIHVPEPLSSPGDLNIANIVLGQNFPNPVQEITTFKFHLPKPSNVRLTVHDILGRKVAVVTEGAFKQGQHQVDWRPKSLGAGLYLYRMQVGSTTLTKQLVVQK